MAALSDAKLYREADRTLSIVLTRPTGADYSLATANVKLAIKTDPNSSVSAFEATSATPATYTDLLGVAQTQVQIPLTQSETELKGTVVLPQSAFPQSFFINRKTRLYYTVWLEVNGLEIVQENSTFDVLATSLPA